MESKQFLAVKRIVSPQDSYYEWIEDKALAIEGISYASMVAPFPRLPGGEGEVPSPREVVEKVHPPSRRRHRRVKPALLSARRFRVLKAAVNNIRHDTAVSDTEWHEFWPRRKLGRYVERFIADSLHQNLPTYTTTEEWYDTEREPVYVGGEGCGTARAQRKIKRDKVAFETLSQCTGEFSPVPPRKPRNEHLLIKLRVAIRHLVARRLTPKRRIHYLVNYLAAIERYNVELARNLFHVGEGQGIFDFKIGMNMDSKKYLDEAIEKVTLSVKDAIGEQKNKIVTGLTAVSGILVTAAAGGTRTSWITGILASLAAVGVMAYVDTVQIAKEFDSVTVKKPVSTSSHTAEANAETPLDRIQNHEIDENLASGLTLLFQTLGIYCGVTGDIKRTDREFIDWASVCTKNLQFNARSTVGLFSFFRNFLSLIKSMLRTLYLKINPDMKPIVSFWEVSSVLRELFKKCNELQVAAIEEFNDPNKLAELEAAITIMSEIIVRISSLDVNTHGRDLLNWCNATRTKLLDIKSQCLRQGMSITCRPTPYVVYMHGPSGVGKSHVLNAIAPEISPILGVPDRLRGAVYARCQGMKHFDGVGDQQILLYDDFAQFVTSTPENTDAAELFQLVTDQPFRPNMAQVEQKGRILDVKLVLIASNQAFPQVTYVSSHEALWRRRNVLINADIKGSCKIPGANDEFDPKFSHLTFKIHSSVASSTDKSYVKEVNFDGLIEYLQEDAEKFARAEKSKIKHKLQNRVSHTPHKTALSIEALEAAVIQTLTDTRRSDMFSKFFSPGDNVKRVKSWLQNKFKFMYDPDKNTVVEAEMDAALDKALVIDGVKSVTIDRGNFLQYLDPKWYKLLDKDQRAAVKTVYETETKEPFVDPLLTMTEETAPANADDKAPPPIEPVVTIVDKTKDKLIVEFEEFKAKQPGVFKSAGLLTYGLIPPQVDMSTYLFCKQFGESFTQLSSFFAEQWTISQDTIDELVFKRAITAAQDRPCMHTRRPHGVDYTMQPHCFIVQSKARAEIGKYIPFHFYKCKEKCVFDHKDSSAVVRLIMLYDQGLYTRMLDFCRNKKIVENLGVQNRLILEDLSYLDLVKKWYASLRKKGIKATIKTGLCWLWNILKWLAYLFIPITAIILVIFSFKSWSKVKEDSDGSYKSKITSLKEHTKQQLYDVRSTWGKSIWQPYDGIPADGEGVYTIVPRQPSGQNITRSHLGTGESPDPNLYKLFDQATCWLYVYGERKIDDTTASFSLRCFKIGGTYILFPKHYLVYMRTLKPETLKVVYQPMKNTMFDINFSSLKLIDISSSELVIALMDKGPRARDLRKHFVSEYVWNHAPLPSHMSVLEQLNDMLTVHSVNPKLIQNFSLTCFDDVVITLPEVIKYGWGGAGRCMSILVDDQNSIRGFHIAGNKHSGYAQIVTRDLLMDLGDIINPAIPNFVNPDGIPAFEIDSTVEHLGVVQGKYAVHLPSKTSIRPSDIHGVFPIRTVPAPLRACVENQYTNPLVEGVKKHGYPTMGFDRDDMEVAEERMVSMVLNKVPPVWSDVKVRSLDLALRGVEGIQSFKSMVLNTSEGFPYMCNRPKGQTSKRWLIHQHIDDNGKIEYALHDDLLTQYNNNMALRKQGIVPPTVFVDCLKDARLPIEKAYTPGKVRIFSVAPTDFFIAFRQYFADFIVSYTHARFDMHHAIGIAPEKDDWTELVRHLSVVGNKFLCGDYKNFGPGFDHSVHKAVYRVILAWYSEYTTTTDALLFQEEEQIRKIMQQELSEPIHLALNVLYRTFSGMCSGSPSTTIDNSLVNTFYIVLAWFALFKKIKPLMATLDAMLRHLRFIVYGDDIIMCVSDEAIDIFNNVTLSKFFKQYGIVYTDALKTGEIRPYCTLKEATFLKRNFIPHPYNRALFLGALEKISIEDCANWITKTIDSRSASVEASYACLQLAYGWGPKYFDVVRQTLVKAWLRKRIVFTPRSWDDYERIYRDCDPVRMTVYVGEANGPPTGAPGETTSCDESKDTIIQEHVQPDEACPTITTQRIIDWAGADYDASYERLLNRYVLLDTFEWRTVDVAGSMLVKKISDKEEKRSHWTLPRDVIKNNITTPTILPFLQHRYVNVDIDVKIVANVNKFMVGRLIASWYYLHDEDDGYRHRTPLKETLYHLLHSEIDAGSSNTAQLCIPYKSYRPWTHLRDSSDLGLSASFGELRLTVVSALQCPSTVYKSCSVSVFVKFQNGSFMGVIPRNIPDTKAEGNMLPMLTTMAAAYLMQKNSDSNRDKPPVQLPPQHMQPMATSSLSIGTGCSEPLHAMRLDARGQCPHPDKDSTSMDLLHIAQHKTLLTNFYWKTTHKTGDQLWAIEVTPTIPLSNLASAVIRSGVVGYAVPPISVMAGLMSEWRGSIEFDFDVVGSLFHTGRLAISFLPLVIESITLEQVQSLPYVIFDIHNERRFTYVTPYIADKPWWPCGYLNGAKDAPNGIGMLFVHILNPLIPMDSVSNMIDILVHVGAAPSFELAIPRQSVWGLPWNIDTVDNAKVYARDGYYPWFVSTWRYIQGGTVGCLRYGEVSDHVAQFDNLKSGTTGSGGGWYYYLLDSSDPNYEHNKAIKYNADTLEQYAFIPVDVGDGWGLIYFGLIKISDIGIGKGKIFPENYYAKHKPDYSKLVHSVEETDYVVGNPSLKPTLFKNTSLEDYAFSSEGNIETCEPTPTVKSTGCGMDLFGEAYNDGKDYMRRYEPLFRIPLSNTAQQSSGTYLMSMDVLPAGYDVPLNNPYSQAARDGGQAIVASGYRFFRGSMNFKLLANTANANIFLEHRPDRIYTSSMFRPAGQTDRDLKWAKNYAQTVAVTSVNKILTINIPYYQMGTLGLLQRPKSTASQYAKRAYTLGEILVGVETDGTVDTKKKIIYLDIYKAIGDDMRFYTYTGFPLLAYIENLLK